MARPRIFVSSTYYDLKYIRNDIERFIRDQGYEPVLNEKGNIPYGSTEKLEEYCYREIDLCDILIAVVGGRFGSESKEDGYSISNIELKTAIDKGKQVYVFVENSVLSEYRVYEANKNTENIVYTAVDDARIYNFIEEIYGLPLNNQIKGFDSIVEVSQYLKEQWAGLFQTLLAERSRRKETNTIEKLESTSNTLNQLVNYLVSEKEKGDNVISDILLSNHPAFTAIKNLIEIPYRVYFQNFSELSKILEARKFEEIGIFDSGHETGYHSWKMKGKDTYLRLKEELFDESNNLKIYTQEEWKKGLIKCDDDEIPF